MDNVYVHNVRVPVSAEVLADVADMRAVMDAARAEMAKLMTVSGNVGAAEREPGVWEPIGRLGRKG